MNMSPAINELVTALAKAQGKILPALKDKTNPHLKSKYADLSSIWDACRVPLSENGLAVIQTVETRDRELVLITTLAHSSGQWMRGEFPIITTKMDPQGIGSALTYYRRYSLASIAGVSPGDDDAEGAQGNIKRVSFEVQPRPLAVHKPIPSSTPLDSLMDKISAESIAIDMLPAYLQNLSEKKGQPIDQIVDAALTKELFPRFKDSYVKELNKLIEVVV